MGVGTIITYWSSKETNMGEIESSDRPAAGGPEKRQRTQKTGRARARGVTPRSRIS